MKYIFIFLTLALAACTSAPKDITPVSGFDSSAYLGQWHEIARIDHSFERDLEQVTANYSLKADGGITVTNRGFNIKKQAWTEAIGKAYFVTDPTIGHLKVSFFGPFYSAYVIFELGDNHEYAFVTSHSKDYLWLLAREPQVSDALKQRFIEQATTLGFDPQKITFIPTLTTK